MFLDLLVLSQCKNNISIWRAKIIRQREHKSLVVNITAHFTSLWFIGLRVTEWQSHRHPRVLSIQMGEIFLCLISKNSPTRFACRGINTSGNSKTFPKIKSAQNKSAQINFLALFPKSYFHKQYKKIYSWSRNLTFTTTTN